MIDGKSKILLVMAGGTGGHVFPALATADLLREQGVHVEWLGTDRGIEARVVPAADIRLNTIPVAGLRGKGLLKVLTAPYNLIKALLAARAVLKRVKPDAVLGMGGFASGPGGLAAWLMGIPVVIHEQNAVPGMTNKVLARTATRVLQAFPGAFAGCEVQDTIGNPVRGPILELPDPMQRMEGRTGPIRLLVVGGSLGAQAINQRVPEALAQLAIDQRPVVWHQAGPTHLNATQTLYQSLAVDAQIVPFIEKMDEAFAWADLVICRSGALTVSELAIAGVASVLVPFPFAVDDHQTANAQFLAQSGAAVLVQQHDLTLERLLQLFEQLNERGQLLDMANLARKQGKPDAGRQLANACLEVMA